MATWIDGRSDPTSTGPTKRWAHQRRRISFLIWLEWQVTQIKSQPTDKTKGIQRVWGGSWFEVKTCDEPKPENQRMRCVLRRKKEWKCKCKDEEGKRTIRQRETERKQIEMLERVENWKGIRVCGKHRNRKRKAEKCKAEQKWRQSKEEKWTSRTEKLPFKMMQSRFQIDETESDQKMKLTKSKWWIEWKKTNKMFFPFLKFEWNQNLVSVAIEVFGEWVVEQIRKKKRKKLEIKIKFGLTWLNCEIGSS